MPIPYSNQKLLDDLVGQFVNLILWVFLEPLNRLSSPSAEEMVDQFLVLASFSRLLESAKQHSQ
jgi:hypothetical protein